MDDDVGRGLDVKSWMVHAETRDKDVGLVSNEQAWKKPSIFKVPTFVRSRNSIAFTPGLVSFGPYHHHDFGLKEMEIHKEEAVAQFIRRAGKPLNELMETVDGIVETLQDSYHGLDEKWRRNKDDFLKLMVTDGCFMFEVLRFAASMDETGPRSSCNPSFLQLGIHRIMPFMRRDMLKIENQLPLLLLKTLAAFQNPEAVNEDIEMYVDRLVLQFFTGGIDDVKTTSPRHHVLGVFRQSLLHPLPTTQINKWPPPLPKPYDTPTPRGAVELRNHGICFRKCATNSLRDISFKPEFAILYLPDLVVDDATEHTFLNIMAYEDQHASLDCDVTSYVSFMHDIIRSDGDVQLLQANGIILNFLGSDKAVVNLFNNIAKDLAVPRSSLIQVRQQLHQCCQGKESVWRAELSTTYFTNPWTGLTVVNTLIILVLTIVQVLYVIRGH